MQPNERGMTLIEVLAALVLLTTAGIALIGTLGAAVRAERQAEAEERATDGASRLLAALSLLSRADLDRRLGERTVGQFVIRVQRPEPVLYRVSLADPAAPAVELLATVVYRPEPAAP